MAYDTRAFGDFGWSFVNAGEQYRKLKNVSPEDKLMMCGLFKQATMGDCEVEEARRGDLENKQRLEWLKYKGMDTIEAMKLYISKVEELAKIYSGKMEEPPTIKTNMVIEPNHHHQEKKRRPTHAPSLIKINHRWESS